MHTHTHVHTQKGSRGIIKAQRSIHRPGMKGRKVAMGGRSDQGTVVGDESPAETEDKSYFRPLSALLRLYVYALHGCLCEVAFTSVYDCCSTRDKRLTGHSSLWALPMYGTAIFLMEALRGRLLAQNRSLPMRLTVYTLFIYMWEFSWGVGLTLLGACPWDYSAHRYNLGGLVTLEYALPWAVAAFIAEQHVIKNTLKIRLKND